MSRADLSAVLVSLSEEVTAKDVRKALLRECKTNARLEALCIAACEIGEYSTEALAYHNLPEGTPTNELGLLGGIITGSLYAFYHVFKHAKKQNKQASKLDAMAYATATELGCVIGATGVEYIAGKIAATMESISNNPLDTANIAIRVAALPIAFATGLGIMSGFTFYRKSKGAEIIANKSALAQVYLVAATDFPRKSILSVQQEGDSLYLDVVDKGTITVEENDLSRSYRSLFDPSSFSQYSVTSPLFRTKPFAREKMGSVIAGWFETAGANPRILGDLFAHKH